MHLGSSADLRRRFRSGRPCLDLVHTGGEDEMARWEIVRSPEDLGRLLGLIVGVTPLPADGDGLARMRTLRGALTRLAYDVADGTPPVPIEEPREGDVAIVNAAAATPPLVPALLPDGAGSTVVSPTATAALSSIARDAVDLFAGPLVRRIRVCAADNCGLLLVDTSKPGNRRWCSMEVCGNRAKIRAHRSRA